jgi:hypothetical protein
MWPLPKTESFCATWLLQHRKDLEGLVGQLAQLLFQLVQAQQQR